MNLSVALTSLVSYYSSIVDDTDALVVIKIPHEENVNVKASSSNLFFMFKYNKFYIPIKY